MSYSVKTIRHNAEADGSMLGVQLGRLAIYRNIPVTAVAQHLGVTRAVVYNWFTGKHDVGKHLKEKVLTYHRALLAM